MYDFAKIESGPIIPQQGRKLVWHPEAPVINSASAQKELALWEISQLE